MIRPARPDDIEPARAVERDAGQAFRDVGMADIAEHEPMPAAGMRAYVDDGRAWVAEVDGAVVGYVLADVVDGCAHVEQISVAPAHQGRGLARALLDEVERWATARGMPALTLTTFRDVPWNRPLYEHLGFAVLDGGALPPELEDRVEHEHHADGLDRSIRVAMRRPTDRR